MTVAARARSRSDSRSSSFFRKARGGRPAPNRATNSASRTSTPRPALPCVPLALNSGLFWPRRSFRRYPGTVRVEVLDPIAPGLEKQAFFARLQSVMRRRPRGLDRGRRAASCSQPDASESGCLSRAGYRAHPGYRLLNYSCCALQPLGQQVQLAPRDSRALRARDRRQHVVAVCARIARAPAARSAIARSASGGRHIADGRGRRRSTAPAPGARGSPSSQIRRMVSR